VEDFPWAQPWARVTTALANAVAELARELSWQGTAREYGLNWKSIATIVKRAVVYGLKYRARPPVHAIGIDEVSRRKGQVYLTVVYDPSLVFAKESFQLYWGYQQEWRAKQHLLKWISSAMRSRLESFKKLARMLRSHLDRVLAWTKARISNGAVEGMNNKIKSISHRSFRFRSAKNFVVAIYHCCALPAER
jgi:transposase